ncbi:hypothetical protein C9I89_07850 [Photobacterium lipolyticum]|uniref:Uncharacterized protein n=1 Tax=Photobacterium lipolyticum TaxID=266810 RepID=A0A2T3N066_9GAMM|nr:hypothetical protein C9I89_07850 [Photobacterium lipolyticum]
MCFDDLALKVLKKQFMENAKRSVSPGGKTAADVSWECTAHNAISFEPSPNPPSATETLRPKIECTA